MEVYDSNTSVEPSSVTYNVINANVGTLLDTTVCGINGTYRWWITTVFKAWLGYELSGNGWSSYQFMIKATSAGNGFKQFLCSNDNLWFQVDYSVEETLDYKTYKIRNVYSEKYLDAVWPPESGVNICQWPFTGNVNQLWEIGWQGNGRYRFYPKAGNQYQYSIATSGTDVKLLNHVNTDTRDYYIVDNNAGSHRFMSGNSV